MLETIGDALLFLTLIEEQEALQIRWQRVLGLLYGQAPLGTAKEKKYITAELFETY